MNELTTKTRMLLFIGICIIIRLFFVYLAYTISDQWLKYSGYLALIPAFGFMFIYLTDLRYSGIEVFGDNIWWNYLRPFHSIMYGLFGYNAIIGNRNAWKYLLADALVGLGGFIKEHYSAGDFNSLL
jgi:hypothetical protein